MERRYPRKRKPIGGDPLDDKTDWAMVMRLERELHRKLAQGTERKHVRRPNARPVVAREIERDD